MFTWILGLLVVAGFFASIVITGVVQLTWQAARAVALGTVGVFGILFVGVVYAYTELCGLFASPA